MRISRIENFLIISVPHCWIGLSSPRDWAVQLRVWSLTSSLCSHNLSQGAAFWLWGWVNLGVVGACRLQGPFGIFWSTLTAEGLLTEWPVWLRWVRRGPGFCPCVYDLETGLSSWETGHSPLGLLCALEVCSQRAAEVAGNRWVLGKSESCRFQGSMMRGCGSLPIGGLSLWLRQVGEVPRVFPGA